MSQAIFDDELAFRMSQEPFQLAHHSGVVARMQPLRPLLELVGQLVLRITELPLEFARESDRVRCRLPLPQPDAAGARGHVDHTLQIAPLIVDGMQSLASTRQCVRRAVECEAQLLALPIEP